MSNIKNNILVTGSSGFIGFHLSKLLLEKGNRVFGIDVMSNYYDVSLKEARLAQLLAHDNFSFKELDLVTQRDSLQRILEANHITIVYHLAAQAGVRHSIDAPEDYLSNNVIATFNLLELGKTLPLEHMIIASTSSVYGANKQMPFSETQVTDTQLSFYAATKKSCESMAHSYANIHRIPITICRFFTVYGPWGRPDMALFKFTKKILEKNPIDVYNGGDMSRDFTFVSDVAESLFRLANLAPCEKNNRGESSNLSPVAPFRILNVGNSKPTQLLEFIREIESNLGIKAQMNFLGMQPGDVQSTFADSSALFTLTGFTPETSVKAGVKAFVDWYRIYYGNVVR